MYAKINCSQELNSDPTTKVNKNKAQFKREIVNEQCFQF